MNNAEQIILIVDDKKENLFSLRQALKELKVKVVEAKNGNDALIASLHHDFALAILDVQMPTMDGYELAELLRSEEKTKELPIIFVSAVYSSEYHVFKGYEAGAVDFLVKPYNPKVLLSKVQVFLELESQRKKLAETSEQLKSINQTLEQRIEVRTAQLSKSVEKLEFEIEKRKQAEQASENARKEWQEIFQAIGHSTMIIDNNHTILEANRATYKLTGLRPEQIIGKKCNSIFHSDSKIPLYCPLEVMKQSGEYKVTESEVEALGKTFIISCTPVFNLAGKLEKSIHIATDITKRKQLQKELIQAHKMEAMGSLAGGIAHDFNNILSAVLGFTDLALRKTSNDQELHDDLEQVYDAGLRARDLIKQILNFARKTDDDFKPVRNDLIAKEVSKFLRSTIPASIEIRISINSQALVLANPVKIHQLLMNLCTNAAYAMNDKGTLEISMNDVILEKEHLSPYSKLNPGKYQRIVVSDTGAGIPPDILSRIFEPFFTTKGINEGTGMGLATVHTIVHECHGDILVDTELGKGSRFNIYLPITEETDKRPETVDIVTLGGSETVLFIDDEPPVCKLAARMLKNAGYKVVSETKSKNALQIFSNSPAEFDLVVTDMTMPIMRGDQLAEKMLEIRNDIPIILVTGYSRQVTPELIEKIGIRQMLPKPFEAHELLTSVRNVLDGKG